jgi:signal transduction histidine kinase
MAVSSDPDSDVSGEIRTVGGDPIGGPIAVIEESAGDRLAEPSDEVVLDRVELHEELRLRNLPNLFWATIVINTAYVLWTVLDLVLAPDQWLYFLGLRIAGVAIITVAVVWVFQNGHQRYTWEAFWLMVLVYLCFIALMFPLVGDSLSQYVMGYTITILGAGLVPVWHPRWLASVLGLSLLVSTVVFFAQWPGDTPFGDLVTNSLFVATAVVLSIVTAIFKYDLARRDFLSRAQLAAVARRESQGRQRLAKTSDDLQQALEKLQELDRLKSKFFANISHELRTPLTLILAPVEVVSSRLRDDFLKDQLRSVTRNAERLLGLINDLLDLSKLDAGGLRLNLAEMDIRSVAASVHENSQPAAMAKSIVFELNIKPSEKKIWADAHRLEIVFTNLVSNAIKFTPEGGRVELRVRDLDAGVQVEVEDSGHGIPSEDLPRIFERFYQVNPTDRRREGGVGIGLALAKELVELHGGTVAADSEPGVFTKFTVLIPFGKEHIRPDVVERRHQYEEPVDGGRRAEDRPALVDVSLVGGLEGVDELEEPMDPVIFEGSRRARILLVDDHDDVRDFIRKLVEPHYDLMVATNGREAWEMLHEDQPDLVVSDVMMPEVNGTELCRAIKGDPVLKSTPVILLTARVGSEATLEAYAHGADDFVAKPFHPRVLLARIRAQLKLRALGLQLAQQEKLAVVGTLAAGIVHEVGNPVNAVLNAARVLSQENTSEEVAKKLIEVIEDGAKRIEGITEALRSHARPAEAGETSACDVREGLDATVKILGHKLDGVIVHRDYLSDKLAMAPAGPMNQVFMNLIDNAIRIGASNIWIRVEEDGEALQVSIGDDGPGVSPTEAERIFDPFFSNRQDGSGSGLGLYLARRMVEEHGGVLRHENRHGGGAQFIVRLPTVGLRRS